MRIAFQVTKQVNGKKKGSQFFSILNTVYGEDSILFKPAGLRATTKYEKYSLNIGIKKDASITTKPET